MTDKQPSKPAIRKTTLPPRKTGTLIKAIVVAVVATACAAALGYYAWIVRAERDTNADELAKIAWRADLCAKQLTKVGDRNVEPIAASATCKTRRETDETKYRDIESHLTQVQTSLKASRQELDDLRKQRALTEKRLKAFKALTGKLKAMIDSGQLAVRMRNGRMVVELPAAVLFPSASAELSKAGKMALMKVAVTLEQFPGRKFMIAGHTDNQPVRTAGYRNNWDLSVARAVHVTEFLIEAGLKPTSLVAAGYGEFDPVASNNAKSSRQKNRRIEIILLPNLEEMPTLPGETSPDTKREKSK